LGLIFVFNHIGSTGGFTFPVNAQDTNPDNFVGNTSPYLGGIAQPKLLALYHKDNNGLKGLWTSAKAVTLGGFTPTATVNLVKNVSLLLYVHNNSLLAEEDKKNRARKLIKILAIKIERQRLPIPPKWRPSRMDRSFKLHRIGRRRLRPELLDGRLCSRRHTSHTARGASWRYPLGPAHALVLLDRQP
jgi:hypothetical protein